MRLESVKAHLTKSLIEKAKWLFAKPYRHQIASLRSLDELQFWNYQMERLTHIYSDAVSHVPYYRDQPDLYPRDLPEVGLPLSALSSLPVLDKKVVKFDVERFWRQPALFATAEHTTGGTTGTPLRVRASLSERGFTQAILDDRYSQIAGTRYPRILRLSGYLDHRLGDNGLFQAIPGTKFAYLSIYKLSLPNRADILRVLRKFRPQVIHGYSSALHQLALLFENDALPSDISPFIVVPTSETTLPSQREAIERFLRTQVYDEYGSQEGQHLVIECHVGTKHIHPARGIVELLSLDSNEPAATGALGRVVVTGLMNRTMPLIRYDIGDTAISTGYASDCQCGLGWPSIGPVYGRTEDLVRARDGRRIGLLSHSTLKDVKGIKESQIVQTGYGRFTYRIALQDPMGADKVSIESHVRRELHSRLQEPATVTFEYLGEIEKTQNGKLRAVVVRFDEE